MALIPCPHCDRHVRDDEAACPFCDRRLRAGARGLTRAAVIAGAALIAPGCSGDKKEVAGPDPDRDRVEQVDSVPAVDAAPPLERDGPPPREDAGADEPDGPEEIEPPPPPPPPPPDDNRNKKPYGAPPNRDRAV